MMDQCGEKDGFSVDKTPRNFRFKAFQDFQNISKLKAHFKKSCFFEFPGT